MANGKTVVYEGPHGRLVIGKKVLERDGDPVALTADEVRILEGDKARKFRVVTQADAAAQGTSTGKGKE